MENGLTLSHQNEVVAIVQARMGSTRLPGKTLIDIAGQPLLAHVLHRVKASRTVAEVWVATTIDPADQAVVSLARRLGCEAYCGSSDDVLDRFYQTALRANASVVVRITADDPFKDPEVIDLLVSELLNHRELDYVSNTLEPTYPEGLDIEVFSFDALAKAWREAKKLSEREHVTPYIWKNPELFRLRNLKHSADLSSLRWTLDYDEDLLFAREVYRRLYKGQIFLMNEILGLLEADPQLARINSGIERNAGYADSLQKDAGTNA